MARYKSQDHNSLLLPAVLSEQIIPGSFAFALSCPVDHELDLKPLHAWFKNDEMGASAYAPRVMSKIVLLLACANDGEIAAHFGYERLIHSTRFTKRPLRKWWTRKSGFFTAS